MRSRELGESELSLKQDVFDQDLVVGVVEDQFSVRFGIRVVVFGQCHPGGCLSGRMVFAAGHRESLRGGHLSSYVLLRLLASARVTRQGGGLWSHFQRYFNFRGSIITFMCTK